MKDKKMTTEKKVSEKQGLVLVEQASKIRALGTEIIRETVKVGESYLELCAYIRKHQIASKMVSFELGELGFHRSRISEITKVAYAADDVWNEFAARTIGFRRTLELERGTVVNLLGESSGETADEIKEDVKEITGGRVPGRSASGLVVSPEAAKKRKFERACRDVLEYAEFSNLRSKKVTLGNGWTLVVSKDKKFNPGKKQPLKNNIDKFPAASGGDDAA